MTLESVGRVASLISAANSVTGKSDADLTTVIQALVDGYGKGAGGLPADTGAIATGVYKPPADITTTTSISHNLGKVPALFIIFREGDFKSTNEATSQYFQLLVYLPYENSSGGTTYGTRITRSFSSNGSENSASTNISSTTATEGNVSVYAASSAKLKAGAEYRWIAIAI